MLQSYGPSFDITGAKVLGMERTPLLIAGPQGRLTERPVARQTAAAQATALTARG